MVGGESGATEEASLPFAEAGNPVMALVAFVAAIVLPPVAAAAAQRALQVWGGAGGVLLSQTAPYLPPFCADSIVVLLHPHHLKTE